MFSFLKNQKPDKVICVCLVNSYAVTGAVVRIITTNDGVKKPVVLYSYEEKIPTYYRQGSTSLEDLVTIHAKKVLEKCRSFSGNFEKIICTLGEPWVTTVSRTAHREKREAFKVTQKMIDDMIARETKLFEQETARNFRGVEMGLVGGSKPSLVINGYPVATDKAIGGMAKMLDVQMSFSLTHASIAENMTGACADVFHHTNISFESMDIARGLLIPKKHTATVIHIGGTTTQIAVITQGKITHTASIPAGLVGIEIALEAGFSVPQNMISGIMKFASDEGLLQHERDAYYQRIGFAYAPLGELLRKGILEIKRHIQIIPEPVFVIANPNWVSVLQPLMQDDIDRVTQSLDYAVLDDDVVYSHDASVRHIPLSLAVLQAVQE